MSRLLAGRIGKPHGTDGEVYVLRISDDPSRFDPGRRLSHEDGRELVIESSRPHRDRFLVRFQGIEDRVAAEGLRGALYVSSEALRDLEEGEFWTHELTGCSVVSTDGHIVGTVDSVIANPGQDLLVVATGSGEVLVPAVAPIVVEVDVAARRVTIDPPEGLLDL